MSEHTDAVTLKDIAARFSYHPNYISALLHRELGFEKLGKKAFGTSCMTGSFFLQRCIVLLMRSCV